MSRGVEREFDLYYYDGLANQQEEIMLTISKKVMKGVVDNCLKSINAKNGLIRAS